MFFFVFFFFFLYFGRNVSRNHRSREISSYSFVSRYEARACLGKGVAALDDAPPISPLGSTWDGRQGQLKRENERKVWMDENEAAPRVGRSPTVSSIRDVVQDCPLSYSILSVVFSFPFLSFSFYFFSLSQIDSFKKKRGKTKVVWKYWEIDLNCVAFKSTVWFSLGGVVLFIGSLKTKGKKIYWRFDCHRRRRRADEMSSATSAFSPLSGGYLLIVLSEPHSEQHKQILLEHLAKGQFKSFFLLFKFLLFNYICTYLLDYYWTKWTVTFKLYRIINNELIFVKSFTQVSIVATAIINV